MPSFIFAVLALVLAFDVPNTAAAQSLLVDAKAASEQEHPSVRCRRLQRSVQSILASEGYGSPRIPGSARITRRPRRMMKEILGYAVKRRTIERGCLRCIARQIRRRVPLSEQAACGAHDLCVEGGSLKRTLSPCVRTVCDTRPRCCRREWDGECVDLAQSLCGESCNECEHGACELGRALSPSCGDCASRVCESDPFCCDSLWADECVTKARSICGDTCERGGPVTPTTTSTTLAVPEPQTTTTTTESEPATTVTRPSSTLPVPTTTMPAPTTTMATPPTTIATPTTTVPAPSPRNACSEVLDFDDLPEGMIVTQIETSLGQPVIIKGTNPRLGAGTNAAVVFDSTCARGACTGEDPDLGTPNQAFGGPGVGSGGAPGSVGENARSLGNVLIIAEDLVDGNNDGFVDDPDDQANTVVTHEIDMSALAPVRVQGLTVIDIESNELPATVELFDMVGIRLAEFALPAVGNNGVARVDLPPVDGVWKMIVTLRGSSAIDEIRFDCPEGVTTTTTVPAPTTTVPEPTTTTVPAPTTTSVPEPTTTTTAPAPTTTVPEPTTTTAPAPTTTVRVTTTSTTTTSTTTSTTTTTTTSTTTTTLPVSTECPARTELTIVAGTRGPCSSDADCPVGTCNTAIGRCQTATELDTGWTGIAHDADLTDNVIVKVALDCPSGGPVCGECNITGIDPEPRYCRCANDNRAICDQPFEADADDCNGATCNCYIGPPLALSAGNTPACVVNRLSQDISGTVNVDTGDSLNFIDLRSVVFLGEALTEPCPYCSGDTTPGDGVRDGTCVRGPNDGLPCDADGFNQTFPARVGSLGEGHSLDCFPEVGKNVSGQGLIIDLDQTTGSVNVPSQVLCGFPPLVPQQCPCGVCSSNGSLPCKTDADCPGTGDKCQAVAALKPSANGCADAVCSDAGGGEGVCNAGPTDKSCDAVIKANGDGFIQCNTDADCSASALGFDAGSCTITKQRECFLDPVVAQGSPDPAQPVGAAIFCIPPTSNAGINDTAGLPGPGRVINQNVVRHLCSGGDYVAGVGCP